MREQLSQVSHNSIQEKEGNIEATDEETDEVEDDEETEKRGSSEFELFG